MEMTASEKIRTLAKRQKKTLGDIAEALGQSRQNFSNKMTRDNFSVKELEDIATVLDCELRVQFISKSSGEIL